MLAAFEDLEKVCTETIGSISTFEKHLSETKVIYNIHFLWKKKKNNTQT